MVENANNAEIVVDTAGNDDRARPRWLTAITALNVAIAVSYLICKPPQTHTLSFKARLFTSAVYILIACLAGSFGTWIALPRRSRRHFPPLALWGMRCWVFLPSIMMFLRTNSVWAPLIAFCSAALMALYSGRLIDTGTYPSPQKTEAYSDVEKNIFITQLRFEPVSWISFAISLSVYGALASAITGKLILLTILLAIGTFVLISQIMTAQARTREKATQRSRPYALIASAIFCAFVALSVPGQMHNFHVPRLAPSTRRSAKQSSEGHSSEGYRTIVLWPVPKKEKKMMLPLLEKNTFSQNKAKPWVIPFYGPYWYFKISGEAPGPMARTTRGDPLKVNVRSTDDAPLLMEAHQYLSDPVDLACCHEIQVVFSNDVSLGASEVGLSLTDSHAKVKSKASQSLGIKSIALNTPPQLDGGTSPIEETVTFPLPRPGTIQKFDQITVILLPHYRYSTAGRKVAIESFVMVPN
jgi:hypothetical protein